MNSKLINLKFKLLQNKTERFNKENILKLNSHANIIFALKKKYPIFFDIIDKQGIQYKQFLSGLLCICMSNFEPFSITIIDKYSNKDLKIFNKYSANYNYINLFPWNKYNIINCNKKISQEEKKNIIINKEQFLQAIIVLFPKFINKYPKLFFELNNKLKDKISIKHLYKYLVYCGDKLAKDLYNNNKYLIKKDKFKFSKNKIETFLKIFTNEQLINILIQ